MNREVGTVDSISNSKHDSFAKHHLVAAHVIIHTVLKLWQKRFKSRFLVDEIEIYVIIGGQLDSNVALYVVKKASFFQVEILLPGSFFWYLDHLLDHTFV